MASGNFHLRDEHNGLTLAAALKRLLPDQTWSQVRKLIALRRVQVNGNLSIDPERRVRAGDVVKLLERPLAPPVTARDVRLVYVDEHLVVVQKPAGLTTLRHREETDLPQRRKQLQPTLDELVQRQLAVHLRIQLPDTNPKRQRGTARRSKTAANGHAIDKRLDIRPVHRLDRDTSGLMLFARTAQAEQKLIRMFARHEVQRAYVAVVYGHVESQTIDTWLVRDRGDGLRGSLVGPAGPAGRESPVDVASIEIPTGGRDLQGARQAITHVRVMEHVRGYTIVECRLQTGRTHQIRIHLAEIGHRLCGEKLYTHAPGEPPREDTSRAPRQALHAAELALMHPISGQPLRFRMALPQDLKEWLIWLRSLWAPIV